MSPHARPLADYPDLLTITEYGQIARRGRRQCYEDVRLGRVASIRLGGAIRIPRVAIERLLHDGTDPAVKGAHGQD